MTKRKICSTWGGGHFQHSDIQSSTFFSTDEWWFDIGGNKSILGVQFKNCWNQVAFLEQSIGTVKKLYESNYFVLYKSNSRKIVNLAFGINRITTLVYPCEEIFARPSRCCLMTTSMMIIIPSWSQSTLHTTPHKILQVKRATTLKWAATKLSLVWHPHTKFTFVNNNDDYSHQNGDILRGGW